ncbi:unnamed protein product [Caenorhabditis auriculariae]|uniref:Uncharacterized protein n=1 Tax=Caenorhabditis auriculariae TaxID=2777116 RepID=A0A8S1HK24_9PELO|nr:unnamed protein product [Caenorhabditis auriculariae]
MKTSNSVILTTSMAPEALWAPPDDVVMKENAFLTQISTILAPNSPISLGLFVVDNILSIFHFVVSSFILNDFSTTYLSKVYLPCMIQKICRIVSFFTNSLDYELWLINSIVNQIFITAILLGTIAYLGMCAYVAHRRRQISPVFVTIFFCVLLLLEIAFVCLSHYFLDEMNGLLLVFAAQAVASIVLLLEILVVSVFLVSSHVLLNELLVRAVLNAKKVMLSIWWLARCVEFWELLPKVSYNNANPYTGQLQKLRLGNENRRGNQAVIYFQHDNARPHIARSTKAGLETYGWHVLPHPPYSPDLAPSDYHLCSHLQRDLPGQKFDDKKQFMFIFERRSEKDSEWKQLEAADELTAANGVVSNASSRLFWACIFALVLVLITIPQIALLHIPTTPDWITYHFVISSLESFVPIFLSISVFFILPAYRSAVFCCCVNYRHIKAVKKKNRLQTSTIEPSVVESPHPAPESAAKKSSAIFSSPESGSPQPEPQPISETIPSPPPHMETAAIAIPPEHQTMGPIAQLQDRRRKKDPRNYSVTSSAIGSVMVVLTPLE